MLEVRIVINRAVFFVFELPNLLPLVLENRAIYNDVYFKQQIARSLLRSWDNFTAPYIKTYASEKEAHLSPMKRIDSQQLIGFINQEPGVRTPDLSQTGG